MRAIPQSIKVVLLLGATSLLGACGQQEDLRAWMHDQDASYRVKPATKQAPKPYSPESFPADGDDPFGLARLQSVTMRLNAGVNPEIARELSRRPQSDLEEIDPSALVMVGAIKVGSGLEALVTGGGLTRQVRVGDRIGASHGRVVSISETRMRVEELVLNESGDWELKPRDIDLKLQPAVEPLTAGAGQPKAKLDR